MILNPAIADRLHAKLNKSGDCWLWTGYVQKDGYAADTDGVFILAYSSDTTTKAVTLELLNRPEPEPVKEAWETAKAGDRLVVKNREGVTRILTKQESDEWDCLLIREDGHSWRGVNRPTYEVKGQLENSGFSNSEPQFSPA